MSNDQLSLVVEPLYRIDEKFGSGTGLGLHIVRTLVSDHGGRLQISSDEQGTLVQVTFLRSQSKQLPESAPHAAPDRVPASLVDSVSNERRQSARSA